MLQLLHEQILMHHRKLWEVKLGELCEIYECFDVTETIYNIF